MSRSDGIVDAHSRQHEIVGIQVGFTVFSAVVLALRLWSRTMVQSMSLGADDWTILAAWLLSLVFAVDVCVQTLYGLGFHTNELPPGTNTPLQLKLYFIKEPIYYFVVSLTKVSILFLYLKLSPSSSWRLAVWIMMAFVMLTAVSISLAGVFQCTPVSKAWYTDEPGTCFARTNMFIANAALNIAQDIVVYFMPIRMLWTLELPRKQRIALVLVFAMGSFVIVTSIVRVPSLVLLGSSTDPTWDDFGAALWSSVEMNVGIVCASLVHFKALIVRYVPRLLSLGGRTKLNNGADGPMGPSIRLRDYRNGAEGNEAGGDLVTYGQSGRPGKAIGVLTELSIETVMRSGDEVDDHGYYHPDRYKSQTTVRGPKPGDTFGH